MLVVTSKPLKYFYASPNFSHNPIFAPRMTRRRGGKRKGKGTERSTTAICPAPWSTSARSVKIVKVERTPRRRKSDFDVFQVKDYHEKKYEGGEEERATTTDRVEVAKDGLGLILERWGCLFIL